MLHLTRSDHCAQPHPRIDIGIVARIAASWQRHLRRRRLKRTEQMLLGLSDRTLKDIGLHRGEIYSAVWRSHDRREHLPRARIDRWN